MKLNSTSEMQECINCTTGDSRFTRGYCSKCYPLILKIEKLDKGILPEILVDIKKHFNPDFLNKATEEYIRQIKWRLEIIKDSQTLEKVSAHDLEYRINGTLRILGGKSLGKINDPIAHYLKDNGARSYTYQLFSKIQLLKPFRLDIGKIYDAGSKHNI